MAAIRRHLVAVLLLFNAASVVLGQATSRCFYMTTAIPRQPKPSDFEEIQWSGGWSDFPLIPADPRDDVCIEDYFPGGNTGTTIIHMEEEIEGDVAIAKLNYQGNAEPEIVLPFLAGQVAMLGAELRNVDGWWIVYITQRQDYETAVMRRYTFDIRVPGEPLTARLTLAVENIDDNFPMIRVESCIVPELGDVPRLTECVYDVHDLDGQLSIQPMTFDIDSDRGDADLFYIEPAHIPGDWYNMKITLGINAALDFEANRLHIFQVVATDSWPNSQSETVMVQVQNVEHRPPRWVEIFAVQQFDEKTYQTFNVRAVDGDTDIDKAIHYRLEKDEEDYFFDIETIEGGHSGAIFTVSPIDRDTLERELFTLSIVAYKYDNESFATPYNVVIIVNDINDQRPEPLSKEYHVRIREETPLTLDFQQETSFTLEFDEPVEFGFHDRDLGVHAQYEVHIESEYPENAHEAFYIAPEVGYQRQTFVMGTRNHSMLDFEDIPFQNIRLRVVAIDMHNNSHVGVAFVNIDLINWNDELPIFAESTTTVTFDETVGAGFPVATIRAYDRDIGDRVEHSLMGNAGTYLTIDSYTGEISVSIDDAFDYHRQSELFVQIRADDTLEEPFHTATSQLIIRLNDINNTPPTLRLPRRSPSVEENVPEGYLISSEITASDPDTTAHLQFQIDWDTSYATKQGRETDPIEFHGCVAIETIFPDPEDTGNAVGRVVAKEIRDSVTIDFEEFEVLYLSVRVVDLNTTEGEPYDESTFTIIIIDMNDNWPVFAEGSLAQEFRVRERSATGAVIGSVLATDIDGPLYNQVRYTIVPREDTPDGLVKIDFYNGQITVDEDLAIDADDPPRWTLEYTVIASDRCYEEDKENCPPDDTAWDTPGDIVINILDINNKVPEADETRFKTTVYIYENAPDGTEVVQLFSTDQDRDELYHTVRYQINYAVNPRLRDFFVVDLDSGQVTVEYTTNEVLDRDGLEPTHRLFFNLIDNFYSQGDGTRNQNTTEVLVVLLDENDNAPELDPDLSWSVSEGLEQGVRLEPEIYAPDRDEPDTPNSHVGYAIMELTVTNRDIDVPQLFNMISIDNKTGELETAMDLKGYWGTYNIRVLAFDHGIPQQMSNETYELEIQPYNYHAPEFVFPKSGTTVRLAKERAFVNGMLVLVNGEFLDRISVTDPDGLHAGIATLAVSGDEEATNFFTVTGDGENLGILMLTQMFPEDVRTFEVTIRATDGGTEPGPLSSESSFTVIFVPTQGEPLFITNTYTVSFFESEVGLTERFQLPLADDPKNYGCDLVDECLSIYYRIVGGNEDGFFGLDATSNVIFLEKELDREESRLHVITVAASNSPSPSTAPLAQSIITITVNVREANPRPIFERSLYTAGISTSSVINRVLLTVRATHSENAVITYTIDEDSMVADSTLESSKENAFLLNEDTGALLLNMQPTATMHGMFEFNVVATDPNDASDTAAVKIYIISSRNRVFFSFVNTQEQVLNAEDFIAQTFSAGFNMTCNIDEVVPATDSNGVAQDTLTEVHAHFIRDNVPVPVEVIEELRSDTQLLRAIQNSLDTQLLVLEDFRTGVSPEVGTDGVQITVYVLAALSAILGFMCLILLVTFIFRTRALNRRLEALSMTKYGSVDSGLNRVAAPGTNKHAVEGSNPIWNEAIRAPDFDAISDISGDSDLIGIEDLPQFRGDYFPPEDSSSTQGLQFNDQAPIAVHNNNFGFNTSPFSSQFTNQQFKR